MTNAPLLANGVDRRWSQSVPLDHEHQSDSVGDDVASHALVEPRSPKHRLGQPAQHTRADSRRGFPIRRCQAERPDVRAAVV
jgi:hypothetical protein